MKTIPALTIGALCLFNIATQTAFGKPLQLCDDNDNHQSDHSSNGRQSHSNGGGGGSSSHQDHSSNHRSSSNGNVHFSAPQRTVHVSTPTRTVPSVTHRVSTPTQSRFTNNSVQSHARVRTSSRSSHNNRFAVSSSQYSNFTSSGWRSHRGWNRDSRGNFFYNHHHIFFALLDGFYYPYYLDGDSPVYLPPDAYASGDSDTVVAVQQALQQAGYYNGDADGLFGPMTSQAITNYQNDHGLAQTGEINDALLSSLGIN